jgi:hypothetical protein
MYHRSKTIHQNQDFFTAEGAENAEITISASCRIASVSTAPFYNRCFSRGLTRSFADKTNSFINYQRPAMLLICFPEQPLYNRCFSRGLTRMEPIHLSILNAQLSVSRNITGRFRGKNRTSDL